jgi:signal transduction histidine kinase
VRQVNEAISCSGASNTGPGLSLVCAATFGVAVPTLFTVAGQPTGWLLLDIPAGVLSVALVPVFLRWPVLGALLAAMLAAVSPAAIAVATVSVLQVAQSRRFNVAVALGVAGAVAEGSRVVWRPVGSLPWGWWLAFVIAAYAALIGWGALAQARRALMVSLRERTERAEADQERQVAEARILERTRIAGEMHDVLAHRLSLLATYAGALEYRQDAPPEQLSRAAGVVRDGVHQALSELREVIGVLRDTDALTEGEQNNRPQPVLTDLPRLLDESRDAGTSVRLDSRVSDTCDVPSAVGRTAYRVVQEGLTNARKHACGQPVEVLLDGRPGADFVVDIRNRLPMDLAAPPTVPGSGTGLIGLTERVQLAGGLLVHQVTDNGEFLLRASLPWPA